jgi:Fe2+ transport system protein FeoA
MKSDLVKVVRRQSIAFLISSFVISALLMSLGFLIGQEVVLGQVCLAIGGGALGSCIGIVMSSLLDAGALAHVQELVSNTLDSEIFAEKADLDHFRKVWHHYILTKVGNVETWRYRKLDFSFVAVRGKLLTSISVPRPSGGYAQYKIEGFLIGSRLLIVQRSLGGAEPHIVQMFPNAGEQFRDLHSGTATFTTWDGDQMFSAVLLGLEPIWQGAEGSIPPEESARLSELWRNNFQAGQKISGAIQSLHG